MPKHWEKLLLNKNKTIKDALEVINSEPMRMAFVVDDDSELIGAVTDGDIRRGLLKGFQLGENVVTVMNTKPKTIGENSDLNIAKKTMEREHINCIPVINDGKIVSLIERDTAYSGRIDNPVFLMAGGFGKRLLPLTSDCPKPLLKVGDSPILEIILERFIHAGFHQFTISIHYMSEMVKEYFGHGEKWGVDIQYTEETRPLGTAGALGLMNKARLDKPVIVMNGDILTGVDFKRLLKFHEGRGGAATMCVREYDYEIPFGVVNSVGAHAESIVEKPKHRVSINSGIYVLEPEIIKKIIPNTVVDMPALLRKEMASGCQVNTYQLHEYWMDIGRKEDYEQAQLGTESRVIPIRDRGLL